MRLRSVLSSRAARVNTLSLGDFSRSDIATYYFLWLEGVVLSRRSARVNTPYLGDFQHSDTAAYTVKRISDIPRTFSKNTKKTFEDLMHGGLICLTQRLDPLKTG